MQACFLPAFDRLKVVDVAFVRGVGWFIIFDTHEANMASYLAKHWTRLRHVLICK